MTQELSITLFNFLKEIKTFVRYLYIKRSIIFYEFNESALNGILSFKVLKLVDIGFEAEEAKSN